MDLLVCCKSCQGFVVRFVVNENDATFDGNYFMDLSTTTICRNINEPFAESVYNLHLQKQK